MGDASLLPKGNKNSIAGPADATRLSANVLGERAYYKGLVGHAQSRDGADRDRLIRCARTVGADFRDRYAASLGDHRRDDRPADPALARPHAAAGEGFQL